MRSYLRYLISARDEHHIHSPFVFNLYLNTICQKDIHPEFKKIERIRKGLSTDHTKIKVTDYGAGSLRNNKTMRPISAITKNSLKSRRFALLLYRLVKFQKPLVAIELGTSMGITTLYQSIALNNASVFYTLEGCPQTASIANKIFCEADRNINLIIGDIDDTLPKVVDQYMTLDYVYFDANHRYEPTMKYFNICADKAGENALFVFDDIHRSKEMSKAWDRIKKDKKVSVTLDLFEIGLVFFKKDQPKQDFILKF